MKKLASKALALSLSCAMLFGLAACQSGTTTSNGTTGSATVGDATGEEGTGEETEPGIVEVPREANQLIIGSDTDMDDNMMPGWTNPSPNSWARDFMTGSYLDYDKDGNYVTNKNFGEYEVKDNEDGSKTFTVKLNKDAKWSDGEPITAQDYLLTPLLMWSKEMTEIDGYSTAAPSIYTGAKEYQEKGVLLKGWHLIDDYTFSGTVLAENFPDYYAIDNYGIAAMPKHTLAPKKEIRDTKDGVELVDGMKDLDLKKVISDEKTGYRYTLTPNTGAYSLAKFDRGTKTWTGKINPNYPGTYDNHKPSIETVVIKKVNQDTEFDELKANKVDLISGVIGGANIQAGLNAEKETNGAISHFIYPRLGYGKIAFHCDFSPTRFKEVRQACAHLFDREDFAKTFTGGHGTIVNGPYGLGMFVYTENKDELNEKLNPYEYNKEKAIQLLEKAGYSLNDKGEKYVQGEGTVRYRKGEDGQLEPLEIEWMATPNNPVSALIATTLVKNAGKVGMKINQDVKDFGVLLENYQRDNKEIKAHPKYSMYNLATGFTNGRFFPWITYDPTLSGKFNPNFIDDKELLDAALALKKSETQEDFVKNFAKYCEIWNDVLPDIPLYSDETHDFFSSKLKNYEYNQAGNLSEAIIKASLSE